MDETAFAAFAEWFAMPRSQRVALGLPQTQKEWAAQRGFSERTVARWKTRDGFDELVGKARDRFRMSPELEPVDDDDDPATAEYRAVRRALVDGARDGDRTALDLYMKHFGKPFVERELAGLESKWPDLSDEELVVQALELIGESAVRAWLEGRGAAA